MFPGGANSFLYRRPFRKCTHGLSLFLSFFPSFFLSFYTAIRPRGHSRPIRVSGCPQATILNYCRVFQPAQGSTFPLCVCVGGGGAPVDVLIRRTAHCFHVICRNAIRES